jgi:hypothetical protein
MKFDFLPYTLTREDRIAEWLEDKSIPFLRHDGIIWYKEMNIAQPLAPFSTRIQLDPADSTHILQKLDAGTLRYTTKLSQSTKIKNTYYIVSALQPIFLEDLDPASRKEIELGIRLCTVRRVESGEIARNAWLIQMRHQSALNDYRSLLHFKNEEDFVDFVLPETKYDDIIHYFGIYYGARMVGFSRCLNLPSNEVHITHIAIDPAYQGYRSMEALNWFMIQYYMECNDVKTIVSCARPLDPTSTEQDFYIQSLNFEKISLDLKVVFRRNLARQIPFSIPFKKVSTRIHPSMHTITPVKIQNS